MKRLSSILCAFVAFCALIVTVSCERRPLMDISNTHYVRVYIDENLKNVTMGFYNPEHKKPDYQSPAIIRVALTDQQTGNVVSERYLRNKVTDERGTYYDGYIIADPGCYNLMAYNFDTESTVIRGMSNHYDISAYTNEIASHLYSKIPSRIKSSATSNESIVYEPDHFFAVDCGDVIVPYVKEIDTLRTKGGDHFFASSLVKSYYLQIRVKGVKYVSSSVSLLDGMSGSADIHGLSMNQDHKVTVYFEMLKSADVEDDESVIYATFNTFGKLPKEKSSLEITFDFLTTYGKHHTEKLDITDEFLKPDAVEHQWILLDHTIVIPEPPKEEPGSGGGFVPEVGPWEDINTDILI